MSGWSRTLDRVLRSDLAAALTAPHGVDRFLEQVNPLWSVEQVKARVVSVARPTPDAVLIRLRPNRHWTGFRAGQYARVGVEVDGVRVTRCYSLTGAFAQGAEIEIAVRRQGRVSNALFQRCQMGDVLTLSQAEGEFVLPETAPEAMVFVAGGSGITPIMAMLRELDRQPVPPRVALLYYVPDQDHALFGDELKQMAVRHVHWRIGMVATRQPGRSQSRRFDSAQLKLLGAEFAGAPVAVCGPAGLIDAVVAACAQSGRECSFERFAAAATVPGAAGSAAGDLLFARSERYVANDGRSLLDQAETAGLRPEAGCRMGICHTCTCRKTAGRVRDLRTGRLSDDGEEDIQLCISVADGDVTLDI